MAAVAVCRPHSHAPACGPLRDIKGPLRRAAPALDIALAATPLAASGVPPGNRFTSPLSLCPTQFLTLRQRGAFDSQAAVTTALLLKLVRYAPGPQPSSTKNSAGQMGPVAPQIVTVTTAGVMTFAQMSCSCGIFLIHDPWIVEFTHD